MLLFEVVTGASIPGAPVSAARLSPVPAASSAAGAPSGGCLDAGGPFGLGPGSSPGAAISKGWCCESKGWCCESREKGSSDLRRCDRSARDGIVHKLEVQTVCAK